MNTITKKCLIDRISEQTGQKRIDVKKTVQMFLDEIIAEVGEGNRLEFRDFGVFEVRERAERYAQNPKTLERVHVPARHTAKFKPGRKMKQAMTELDTRADALKVHVKATGAPAAAPASSPAAQNGALHAATGA